MAKKCKSRLIKLKNELKVLEMAEGRLPAHTTNYDKLSNMTDKLRKRIKKTEASC